MGLDLHGSVSMMLDSTEAMSSALAPRSQWSDTREDEHFVQFYETEAFLLTSVGGFIDAGLKAGDAVIVVGTSGHRTALQTLLTARGHDVPAVVASEQYVPLDAVEMLETFLVNGSPDATRFIEVVGGIIRRAGRDGRRVRIFGEMVAVLWAEGNRAAAIALERLWNHLHTTQAFSLFCGYHLEHFKGETDTLQFISMCAEHARVIPAESYTVLAGPDERLRMIAQLQQKANRLESEVAERKAAEHRFRFLAESVPQKIFTARPTGEVDYCNAQWTEFTGIDCQDMRNWGWTQVIHPEDLDQNMRQWQHSLAGGEPFQFEHRFRRADGAYRWHLTRAHAMHDTHGAVLMWVGSHTDIDDQKRREAVLARSIRQRDEFLSAISHDLKTPLTVLRGQAQILQRRAARGALDQDALLRGLEQIESRSRTMAKLVEELLDVTRLRAGEELPLDRQIVDLVALVREVIAGQNEATDRHHLVVRPPERPLTGWWDRMHLQRVVENLVNNATKYSPQGGEIALSLSATTSRQRDYALLTVQDHGIGIAEDDLPQIFEWFYRGKNARDGTIGTGLGLAGVRQIVQQHGGTITVTSQEGIGSTFCIRLPLDAAPESDAAAG